MGWIYLLIIIAVLAFGVLVFRWAYKQIGAPPEVNTKVAVPRSRPRPTASSAALAAELVTEFGGSPPAEILWERSESHGLEMFEVDAAIDALLRDRDVREETISLPDSTIDLRSVESVRMRVKGTHAYIKDSDRNNVGGSEYLLIREPENDHDAMAVAVFTTDGRKVGYVSSSRAAMISPLLDKMHGDAYRVAGAGATDFTVKLWVDVPKVEALRRFVSSRSE